MNKVKVTFTTEKASKAETLKLAMETDPNDRLKVFLQMSELFQNLYPYKETDPDQNFHIYPHERK